MTRLDRFLVFAESHRLAMLAMAGALVVLTAALDFMLANISVGFLYLFPVLLSAAALNRRQIVGLAILCGYLRESFDPLQMPGSMPGLHDFLRAFDPLHWAPGATGRLLVASAAFAMTGFFVTELNQRRRLLSQHLREHEEQIRLRREAERQLRILIDTSPLAILTLDGSARILLANESTRQLLAFENEPLEGADVGPYLPILARMLRSHHSGGNIRTNVECRGQRRGGEVFLAHVWLSTYRTSRGAGLAAVVWDASESLRDREDASVDSMMATSRVLIGAMSHEIRNLAAAASSAYAALTPPAGGHESEPFQALGSLIQGLKKIASSGLRMASARETAAADLGTVLDETRIVIEPPLHEAGIDVAWDIARGLPLVQADHHSLLQVFVNLARNSRQAMEHSEIRKLSIEAVLESDLVVVRFRDSGPGVAHPEELFRPFQPGAYAAGLGLYISRAILRAHGGGLRYEPQPRGSCFAVELWPMENSKVE